jgi:hypothetical protein
MSFANTHKFQIIVERLGFKHSVYDLIQSVYNWTRINMKHFMFKTTDSKAAFNNSYWQFLVKDVCRND